MAQMCLHCIPLLVVAITASNFLGRLYIKLCTTAVRISTHLALRALVRSGIDVGKEFFGLQFAFQQC